MVKGFVTEESNWINVWGKLYHILNLVPAGVNGLVGALGAIGYATIPAGLMEQNTIHDFRPLIFVGYLGVYLSIRFHKEAFGKAP